MRATTLTATTPVVRAEELRRVVAGGFAALGPLDVWVGPGELPGVPGGRAGPSGPGRSTLPRLTGRLDAPDGTWPRSSPCAAPPS